MTNFNIHYHHSEPEESQITWAVTNIMELFLLEILAIQVYSITYSFCEVDNYTQNITLRNSYKKKKKLFRTTTEDCLYMKCNK